VQHPGQAGRVKRYGADSRLVQLTRRSVRSGANPVEAGLDYVGRVGGFLWVYPSRSRHGQPGHRPAATAALDPNVRWYGVDEPDADGSCHNRDEALAFLQRTLADGVSAELLELREAGDRIVSVVQTHVPPEWGDQPPPHGEVGTVRNGKIVEIVVYPTIETARWLSPGMRSRRLERCEHRLWKSRKGEPKRPMRRCPGGARSARRSTTSAIDNPHRRRRATECATRCTAAAAIATPLAAPRVWAGQAHC
jgi:hypothetical protein